MKPAIQDLIQKYLQGEATAEEQAIVEQYYNSFSEEKIILILYLKRRKTCWRKKF